MDVQIRQGAPITLGVHHHIDYSAFQRENARAE